MSVVWPDLLALAGIGLVFFLVALFTQQTNETMSTVEGKEKLRQEALNASKAEHKLMAAYQAWACSLTHARTLLHLCKEKLRQEALKQTQQVMNDETGKPVVEDLLFNNLIIQ